jgi:hypothetical protein
MKRCPFCTESLVDTATVCGRCKNALPAGGGGRPVSSTAAATAAPATAGASGETAPAPTTRLASDTRLPALKRIGLIVAVVLVMGYSVVMVRDALGDPEEPEAANAAQTAGPMTEIPALTVKQVRLQTGFLGRVLSAVSLVPKGAALQRRERAIVYFAGEGLRVAREACTNGSEVMRVGGELAKVTRADAGYVLARSALTQLEACRLVIVMRAIRNPVDEGLERSFLQ